MRKKILTAIVVILIASIISIIDVEFIFTTERFGALSYILNAISRILTSYLGALFWVKLNNIY